MTAREPGPRPPDVVLTANQTWLILQSQTWDGGLTRYVGWYPNSVEVEELIDLFHLGLLYRPDSVIPMAWFQLTDDGLVVYARLSRNQPRGTSDGLG